MKKLLCALLLVACCLTMSGCSDKSEKFGLFSHDGYSLTTLKKNDLSYEQARSIVAKNSVSKRGLTTDQVEELTSTYNSLTIYVTYWDSNTDKVDVQTKIINGRDLTDMFTANEISISSGVLVKNIFMSDPLLNELEEKNSGFTNTIYFNSLYSYHEDADERLVIRSNDFQEITTDVTGGISAAFIQENEVLYDNNNLITKFQSSFGMQFNTLGSTQLHGTVLEVDFEWQLKS